MKKAVKKIFTVTDLGGGDGGKGGVVHKISTMQNAHTIIKVGGAQGSHGVRTEAGKSFNFGQFGCGTFEGTRTHLSKLMVIEPYNLVHEGRHLKTMGVSHPFELMTIDEDALCISPFQTLASQLKELWRKSNAKGTVGMGAGETMLDWESNPEIAIFARDLNKPTLLKAKLEAIKIKKKEELQKIFASVRTLWPEDQDLAKRLILFFGDDEFIDSIVGHFKLVSDLVKIVDEDYLRGILKKDGVTVIESSHGILTDRYYGFYPHVSRLRTIPMPNWEMIKEYGYDGQLIKLAVTRAYQIRHGAGPMVTENPDWQKLMLPDSSKEENRWQGKVRIGPLDLVTTRYALDVCGGPQNFDGLALTWFDQVAALGRWDICQSYDINDNGRFFTENGRLKVSHLQGRAQIRRQTDLTRRLTECRPRIDSIAISGLDKPNLCSLARETIKQNLGLPLRMISFGPTEADKICF